MSRILRCLVCFLVIFCLVINLSPIKADAMSGGLLAPLVSGAAVTVSAPVAIGACLIALGIMAGTNDDFQRVVSNAVDSLGEWVKDGTVELIQTVDTLGKKAYYVAGDMLEAVRNYAFVNTDIQSALSVFNAYTQYDFISGSKTIVPRCDYVAFAFAYNSNRFYEIVIFSKDAAYSVPGVDGAFNPKSLTIDGVKYYYYYGSGGTSQATHDMMPVDLGPISGDVVEYILRQYGTGALDDLYISNSFNLGVLPSVPVDGSSARQWSEEYTNRGLYVVEGSGGSSTPPEGDDGGDNNGKWYWPLVLGAGAAGAGAGIGALTQQEQWTGETPQEFDDYTTKTEFEILSRPEVEFGTGIELQPVTDPAPDSGGDSGDNPGAGTDPDEDPDAGAGGSNDYSSWFSKILALLEKIWNSILEIPTKFATWFDNIISEIQELPSKFATWFDNIISAIQELPSKFAEWFGNLAIKLENIWEAICNIPEAIGHVLRSIFVPSEDFLTDKVQDLRNRFNWIEPILGYGEFIKVQLVNPEPPVLYVHLGNAEGSYNYGGTVKFLDLTWYERYKSQGDAIISGFLWALFAWRMYVKLPGIINGVAGDVGHISFGESAWQKTEGRKERKEKGGKNK